MLTLFSSWFALAIFANLTQSFVGILQKAGIDDDTDTISYSIFFLLACGFFALPFAIYDFSHLPTDAYFWRYIFVIVLLSAIANIGYYKAIKLASISQLNIIFSSISFWAVLGGIFFLGEGLTSNRLLGFFLIISAFIIVFWEHGSFKGFGLAELYASIYALGFGLISVLEKQIITNIEPTIFLVIIFWCPAVLISIIYRISAKNIGMFMKINKANVFLVLSSALIIISSLFFLYSLKAGGDVAVVSPIWESSSVITILLGIIILNEREKVVRKLISAGLILAAIVMLGL